jgi:hypothetical protein
LFGEVLIGHSRLHVEWLISIAMLTPLAADYSAAGSRKRRMGGAQRYPSIKVNTAGGCPAASYLLLLRQKKVTRRKGDPGLPPLRGPLRCWLRHNLKVSLRRNKLLRSVLSAGQASS